MPFKHERCCTGERRNMHLTARELVIKLPERFQNTGGKKPRPVRKTEGRESDSHRDLQAKIIWISWPNGWLLLSLDLWVSLVAEVECAGLAVLGIPYVGGIWKKRQSIWLDTTQNWQQKREWIKRNRGENTNIIKKEDNQKQNPCM